MEGSLANGTSSYANIRFDNFDEYSPATMNSKKTVIAEKRIQ